MLNKAMLLMMAGSSTISNKAEVTVGGIAGYSSYGYKYGKYGSISPGVPFWKTDYGRKVALTGVYTVVEYDFPTTYVSLDGTLPFDLSISSESKTMVLPNGKTYVELMGVSPWPGVAATRTVTFDPTPSGYLQPSDFSKFTLEIQDFTVMQKQLTSVYIDGQLVYSDHSSWTYTFDCKVGSEIRITPSTTAARVSNVSGCTYSIANDAVVITISDNTATCKCLYESDVVVGPGGGVVVG